MSRAPKKLGNPAQFGQQLVDQSRPLRRKPLLYEEQDLSLLHPVEIPNGQYAGHHRVNPVKIGTSPIAPSQFCCVIPHTSRAVPAISRNALSIFPTFCFISSPLKIDCRFCDMVNVVCVDIKASNRNYLQDLTIGHSGTAGSSEFVIRDKTFLGDNCR